MIKNSENSCMVSVDVCCDAALDPIDDRAEMSVFETQSSKSKIVYRVLQESELAWIVGHCYH